MEYTAPMTTAKDLRKWIWEECGGIRRTPGYWGCRETARENSSAYAFLDRRDGQGTPADVLAAEIAERFPWYGITDEASLFEWLARNPRG